MEATMRARFLAVVFLAALLCSCANWQSQLVPGQSTRADVESVMGRPVDERKLPDGSVELWYPQMPYGIGTYAAVIEPDGRLRSFEQRLDEKYIAQIVPNKTTAEQVLEIVGPPYRRDLNSRMQREIWTYKQQTFPFPKALFVQMSPADHVVREVYYMDDPEVPRPGNGGRP